MIQTHIDDARERVKAEQKALEAKGKAIETFTDQVGAIAPDSTTTATTTRGLAAATATQLEGSGSTADGCARVREVFAETVRPHSVETEAAEPLLATISTELTDSIAAAVAPDANVPLSPGLKRAIVSEAESRRTEIEVMSRTVDSEAELLADAAEQVDEIVTWIADADETPLSTLGFEALRRRHEQLSAHRERCDELAAKRQAFLRETTSEAVETGVRHEHIIPQLYEDFPVEYPVLSTTSRLDGLCQECQRAVRDHLTRRV
jgi:hypothetical protein